MNALTLATTVRELCSSFREAEASVRRCFAELVETETRLNAVYLTVDNDSKHRWNGIRIEAGENHYTDFTSVEKTVGKMRRQAWQTIAARLELHRVMSVKRKQEHDEYLAKAKLPELTEEEVEKFVQRFATQMLDMFEESVKEVFNWLRPNPNWDVGKLKTNQKNARLEIGEKIIIGSAVSSKWDGRLEIRDWQRQRFIALENIFNLLDGRGGVSKTYNGEIVDAVAAATNGVGETPYFSFRNFRNGNMHLRFKRLDLLSKFNSIAGGKNLKDAT